ncbi:MAG: pyridoxine 5'-phosphate oxidase C-terminal domain-containing protein [SAR86 cluster bacterium]|nr:pyridoxine 5'-phosphate oxidase C-terminal domain-containing protein [SAR86 cluster bacterium]
MITLEKLKNETPYRIFDKFYKEAEYKKQNSIEAICISSYDEESCSVDSRYVNLKYIIGDQWTFFSNYKSSKSKQFYANNNISAVLYWNSTNVQIRMKAKIYKSDKDFSDQHFSNRNPKKNALAISSMQSQSIESHKKIIENYKNALENETLISKRPDYWGGYTFIPHYFEFWKGQEHRLNKRKIFYKQENSWKQEILQP